MGYKYGYFDNQLIGVDQLNEITKRLVSGGISAVYSGNDFSVSELNSSNVALLCGGVVPETDSCLRVDKTLDGKYLINAGVAFFENGTSMEVLNGGEIISASPLQYIYLVSDENLEKCYIDITNEMKTQGYFVCLAQIASDGSVVDKRLYAKGKARGFYASSGGLEFNVTVTLEEGDTEKNIPIGNGAYTHILIEDGKSALTYCTITNGVVNVVVNGTDSAFGNAIVLSGPDRKSVV